MTSDSLLGNCYCLFSHKLPYQYAVYVFSDIETNTLSMSHVMSFFHYHNLSRLHLSVLRVSSAGSTVTNTICIHKQVDVMQRVMVLIQCA